MPQSSRTHAQAPAQSTDEAFEFTQHARAYLLYSQGRSARRFFINTTEDPQNTAQSMVRAAQLPRKADLNAGPKAQAVTRHERRVR
jgi:hypothetical protein